MSSRRVLKAAEAVREVVSMAILTELKDPRVRDVTVTRVEMTADMRTAKVYVSIRGDETHERLTLRGLESAAGFLQSRIKDRIDTRYTPRIEFVLDQGVKQSIAIAKILRDVLPPEAEAAGEHEESGEHEGDELSDEEADDAPRQGASAQQGQASPPSHEEPV